MLPGIKNISIILVLAVFIFSCSENNILPEDEFINIYIDILVAQDTTTDASMSADSIKTLILKNHNVTDSLYAKTIEFYNDNPDKWVKFFDDAIKQVEEMKSTEEQ